MAESARRFRANRKIENRPCGWCGKPLQLGEEAAVCTACEVAAHAACWDANGGCASGGCANAPLKKLDDVPKLRDAGGPGRTRCPHCNEVIPASEELCPFCEQVTSPDGVYHGPQENAPGATASLVWGIVGLFICGLILGILAIVNSRKAAAVIAESPRWGGSGLATAGLVLGIIDIVAWALIVLVQLGSIR